MCRFFEVSRSGYYDYVKRMAEPAWDLPLANKIKECSKQPREKKRSLQSCSSTVTKAFNILHTHILSLLNHTT